SAPTNVPFTVQACWSTNFPAIIPLTNGIPYIAGFSNQYVAPPGPPRWFFFEFSITNPVNGALFELYNLSGDAHLVVPQDVVRGQPTYFDDIRRLGSTLEQTVLRASYQQPALRGNLFLRIYNHETNNVAYTIPAVTSNAHALLVSAHPIISILSP